MLFRSKKNLLQAAREEEKKEAPITIELDIDEDEISLLDVHPAQSLLATHRDPQPPTHTQQIEQLISPSVADITLPPRLLQVVQAIVNVMVTYVSREAGSLTSIPPVPVNSTAVEMWNLTQLSAQVHR